MHAAEGLQLARYFMFEQLYFHRVRRALDLHLKDFLRATLPGGVYPTGVNEHLLLTDDTVLVEMTKAADDDGHPGHEAAGRILFRKFYRVLYEPTQNDLSTNINAANLVLHAAESEFGKGMVGRDREAKPSKPMDFAVARDDGQIVSSLDESKVLDRIPAATFDRIFVVPELRRDAERWLQNNLRGILQTRTAEES